MKGIGLMRRRRGSLVVVTALASLGFASAANAATYNVNDTRDLSQSTAAAAAGTCVSTASTCTLRAAIEAANENGGASTINLPAGTYPISSCTTASSTDITTGSFKVNPGNNSTQITVVGAGSGNTVINAQGKDRIFDVWPNGVLDVQKTTLENGNPGNGCNSRLADLGGAILSDGHLSAEADVFTGNTTQSPGAGGGIYASSNSGSTLSATGDVFQNNSTTADGGAIETEAPNDATVAFCLLQSNNASSGDGGAIEGSGTAELTLNFDDFVQNVAEEEGGGVAWYGDGALNITNSLFTQNQTTSDDGGAFFIGSDVNVNVSNSSFDGNSAADNGGVAEDFGSNQLTLTEDKFTNNTAGGTEGGGAFWLTSPNQTSGTLITSSEFDGNSQTNSTDPWGGAITWSRGILTLYGDSFVLNKAGDGGALFVKTSALLTMVDTTMSRNTASYGGAIYHDQVGPLTMINDTIAFNNALAQEGGGVEFGDDFTAGGSAATGFGVENTTIAENSGGDCGDNSSSGMQFVKAADTGYNNDSDQSCFGGVGGPNDKTGVNPLLSNPANNGGPTAGGPGDTETVQTDAESSSSPTVDAGNNNGCPSVDERGVSRPQGAACDIGAFEFGASPGSVTTGVNTTVTTFTHTTVTSTTTKHVTKHNKPCPKGKHKSHGKCVKNKKPKKKK